MVYKKEFNADRNLSKKLDKKYRGIKETLFEFLSTTYTNSEYKYFEKILKGKEEQIKTIVRKILKYEKE